jgi:(R)-2-hydroxyacyl-CoA dehydratese activating ATPase
MIVAGCDIGSLTAKAVIMQDGKILASHVMRGATRPEQSAREVMDKALAGAGLALKDIAYCVGTGYGREKIPFVNEVVSEIKCHGMAVKWLMPSVKTIIDVGGQDAKAIRVDENGDVIRYVYNDKCASGSGRFLEIMARALEIGLEELGDMALRSDQPIKISNQCTVFAETEVISQLNGGKPKQDIAAGIHRAMAHRIASLARSIELEEEVAMSGGVAKNVAMYKALEDVLNVRFVKNDHSDPQINGALGAALHAALQGGGR